MTWTKLSDDYSDDNWTLSDAAFRLHTEGLNWSNRKLLDLRLAKDEMRLWAKRPEAAPELVANGWWRDDGDAYVIVHHGCYQRTREQVLNQQEVNQQNAQKGGRPKGPPRERAPRKPHKKKETDSVSDSVSRPAERTDSVSDSSTERDGTGQDRETGVRPVEKSEPVSGNGQPVCRYCGGELKYSSAQARGYCNKPACIAVARNHSDD